MVIVLQVLLGFVSLICLLEGMYLLIKGAKSFLPQPASPPPVLDNLFRFLSGIFFGLGFLVGWAVFNFHRIGDMIYFIGILVVFSGLGRWYSKTKVGSAGKYFDFSMVFEIVLGVSIILLQYFR